MRIILSGILVFIGMITLLRSSMIYSDSKLKEKEGKNVLGKILGMNKTSGILTIYTVEVEFVINEVIYTKRIASMHKSILKYKIGEYIPLIYVERKDRLFLGDGQIYENVVKQVLLIAFSVFAVLMASLLI